MLFVLAGGSGILIYGILWIVLPEAKTPSDRLRMRGNAVTLSGIANNLNTNDNPNSANRPVGAFVEDVVHTLRPAVSLLGTVIRWFVGGLLLIIGLSFLVSVLTILGAAIGLLPANAVLHLGDAPADSMLQNVPTWGVGMGALALGIPALALVLLALRLFLRRSLLSLTAALSLLGLWIVGLVGTGVATAQVANKFRSRGSATTTRTFAPGPYRTVALNFNEADDYLGRPDFALVAADSSQDIRLEQEITARGSNRDEATRTATAGVDYDVQQRDSVILFDQGIRLRPNVPFRGQNLKMTLHLPLGRTYRLDDRLADRLPEEFFLHNDRPQYNGKRLFRLRPSGQLECLDCIAADGLGPDNDDSGDSNDSGDEVVSVGEGSDRMSIHVNTDGDKPTIRINPLSTDFNGDLGHYGSGRKTLTNPERFTEIKASGDYRVLVRQGETFAVEAAGDPADLRDTNLEVNGDQLVIRRQSRGTLLFSLNFNRHPVLVRVTLPALHALDLSGACRADVAGFRDAPLSVDGTGACTARLEVEAPSLTLDLSGACHVTATGHADKLNLNGAGACVFSAPDLHTRTAAVDVAGGSEARLNVSETLKADASGASTIEYTGNPKNVDSDASGASRVSRM